MSEMRDELEKLQKLAIEVGRKQMRNDLIRTLESKSFSDALSSFHRLPAGEGSNLVFMSMLSAIVSEVCDAGE